MRWPSLRWWLIASVATCLLVVLLPAGSTAWMLIARGSGLVAVGICLLVVSRMVGPARRVWWGLWLFQLLTVAGDIVYEYLAHSRDADPFPSVADALYLSAYVCALAALVQLVAHRFPGRDREAWLDTAIMSVAAVTVVGAFVILPMLSESDTAAGSTAVALSYPLLDLVVLTALIRLMIGRGRPNQSLGLVVASMAATLSADLVFTNLVELGAEESAAGWVDALFLAGVLLLTAAVLAPGAAEITEPRVEGPDLMTRRRATGLAIGVLTPPALLAGFAWTSSSATVRLLACASVVVVALGLWRMLALSAKVEDQARLLAEQARTDSLTGLPNRRTWDFEVQRMSERALMAGTPLTVAVLDLDLFKETNDRLGHPAGDRILRECADVWQLSLGPGTFLARYGGEEFAVALPGFSAARAATRVLEAVRLSTPHPTTVSIGVAEQGLGESVVDTFARADLALYRAKANGRNRVEIHDADLADAG